MSASSHDTALEAEELDVHAFCAKGVMLNLQTIWSNESSLFHTVEVIWVLWLDLVLSDNFQISSALQDMTASLEYYADVVDFTSFDSDFMHAHRVCAIFASHHIILASMMATFVILITPATFMAIMQIFGASLQLIMEAAGAEN